MSLMYRFALLSTRGFNRPHGLFRAATKGEAAMVMLERSCDDCKNAQGAHELQGQVASFPCFGPVSPCYRRPRGCPHGGRVRPFPVFLPWLTGKSPAPGCARCPVFILLFTGIYRQAGVNRTGLAPGLRHETRKCLRRRSLAAPAQRPQATRYSRSSRNGSAS